MVDFTLVLRKASYNNYSRGREEVKVAASTWEVLKMTVVVELTASHVPHFSLPIPTPTTTLCAYLSQVTKPH